VCFVGLNDVSKTDISFVGVNPATTTAEDIVFMGSADCATLSCFHQGGWGGALALGFEGAASHGQV